jgi:hypothetical protein
MELTAAANTVNAFIFYFKNHQSSLANLQSVPLARHDFCVRFHQSSMSLSLETTQDGL